MRKLAVAGLVLSLSGILMGASECNVGGKAPNVDDPDNGARQCVVIDRTYNANGVGGYIKIDCNGGDPSDAVKRSIVDANEWPMCRSGAYWPECKTAK